MHINIVWQDIDTILLDMDNTLLDLALDNYFWQKLVPETQDAKNGVMPQEATEYARQQYYDIQYMPNWYCLDYWSEQLGLDTCVMIIEMGPRTVLREDITPFPEAPKASGKQRILLVNTHPYNLATKLKHTDLDAYPDLLLSTRTFGYPKGDQRLWHAVVEAAGLKAERILFIGDSEAVFDTAAQSGIRYCFGVTNPDSGIAEKQYQRHSSLNDYRRLIPSLMWRRRHKRETCC